MMNFVKEIIVILALVVPKLSGQQEAKSGITEPIKAGVPLIERMSFPMATGTGTYSVQNSPAQKGLPIESGSNTGQKPLAAKSSYPLDPFAQDITKALAFMAEGNIILEQDDNGTPQNPYDDKYVMINERGETVDLTYGQIVMIRDVNHRLNSIFETTPGSVTPAITTVVKGQGASVSASSRSMSFNAAQSSSSSNSASGSVKIGYIPSRTIRRGNRRVTIRALPGMESRNALNMGSFLNMGNRASFLNLQRQHLLRNRLIQLSLLNRFRRFPVIRPFVRGPVFFRYF